MDALLRCSKNMGDLEFWESHLETIAYLQLNWLGGYPDLPTSKEARAKTSDVFAFQRTLGKNRALTKQTHSASQRRRQQKHNRELAIEKVFQTDLDLFECYPDTEKRKMEKAKQRQERLRKKQQKSLKSWFVGPKKTGEKRKTGKEPKKRTRKKAAKVPKKTRRRK